MRCTEHGAINYRVASGGASGLYKPAMQKIRDEMQTHSYRAHVVAAGAY